VLASVNAEQRQREKALTLLKQSVARHEAGLCMLKLMPRFRSLESEPRLRIVLRRMNLPG